MLASVFSCFPRQARNWNQDHHFQADLWVHVQPQCKHLEYFTVIFTIQYKPMKNLGNMKCQPLTSAHPQHTYCSSHSLSSHNFVKMVHVVFHCHTDRIRSVFPGGRSLVKHHMSQVVPLKISLTITPGFLISHPDQSGAFLYMWLLTDQRVIYIANPAGPVWSSLGTRSRILWAEDCQVKSALSVCSTVRSSAEHIFYVSGGWEAKGTVSQFLLQLLCHISLQGFCLLTALFSNIQLGNLLHESNRSITSTLVPKRYQNICLPSATLCQSIYNAHKNH